MGGIDGLYISTIENPAVFAASLNRRSLQRKALPAGRCWHHNIAAASCSASAARNGYFSTARQAKSLPASSGLTSCHPVRSRFSDVTACRASPGSIDPLRSERSIALAISTGEAHQTTGV
jgi:hypothetical protein